MGKVISLLVGAVITIFGLILLAKWWFEMLFVIRGLLPITLVLIGLIALMAGFSELKDALGEKK